MIEYNVVYLLCNILRTYTMFKFMWVFLDRENANKRVEIISYALYYLVVSLTYLFVNKPLTTIALNLVSLFLITCIYRVSFKKRILTVLCTYSILLTVECAVFWGMGLLKNNLSSNAQLIIVQILITIISYIVVLASSSFKLSRRQTEVPVAQWIAIITIPIITMILAFVPIFTETDINMPLLSVIILSLFFVNIFVFYLYDQLLKAWEEKLEKELLLQQNIAYEKQLETIYQSQEDLRIFRHDMKNHLSTLKIFIDEQNLLCATQYITDTFAVLLSDSDQCKSGNYVIDSILNFKIAQAKKSGICIGLHIAIPETLNIYPFDLNIILGNLMDNAITATKQTAEKKIDIVLKYDCDVLLITISNSFAGSVKTRNGKLVSTHKNAAEHGIGLTSVARALKKYEGDIQYSYGNKRFIISAMMFLNRSEL